MTSWAWTVLVYVVLGLALVALELTARLRTTRPTVPRAGALLGSVLRHRSAQLALVLAWWWLGWHFFCS